MGYQTKYELAILEGPSPAPDVLNKLDEGYDPFEDAVKWYSCKGDMCNLSASYPETLFRLHGEGEEPGDIWRKFFKGGKMIYEWRLTVMPPEWPPEGKLR